MTHDEAVDLFRRRQERWDRRDPAALAADHAPDGVVESPMFATRRGMVEIEAAYRGLFSVFPDWALVQEDAITDGERVAVPFRVTATHVGDFMGLPGSGRRFEVHGVLLYRMAGELIAHERRVYDFTGLLLQLGVLRAKPAR
jgi:C-1 hydroxylase